MIVTAETILEAMKDLEEGYITIEEYENILKKASIDVIIEASL